LSDGDPLFMARAWQDYAYDRLKTKLLITTPAHPQADGQSERAVQTLSRLLRAKHVDNKRVGDWPMQMVDITFAYNNTIHDVTKQTPLHNATRSHANDSPFRRVSGSCRHISGYDFPPAQ
jgi:hypothetical protein